MATWKSKNSMLTKKGVEILNKVKAGIGNIHVTRIVAGSGRVSESTLFFQTAVSGATKPMVISQTSIRDSGSEISICISNNDFTEPFNLNQIGVYVSHPDYNEDQLYHISQCDAEGFDAIPALEETPITLGYSLFLEHGNSSSVTITVDPAGAVLIKDFEEYKVQVGQSISQLESRVDKLGIESPDAAGCYYRKNFRGGIEWINPPMLADEEYRTVDWVDAVQIYKKVLVYPIDENKEALGTVLHIPIPHGIDKLDRILKCSVSEDGLLYPYIEPVNGGSVSISLYDEENVYIQLYNIRHYFGTLYVMLEYSKLS